MISNFSFEEGWQDMLPSGSLINQQPNHWSLFITPLGELIFDTGLVANGIPECVHKLNSQLPDNEKLGGENALILDGQHVYKVFHRGAKFGVQLSQIVRGLEPNRKVKIVVPINCHFDELGGNEPDDIEVRVKLTNGDRAYLLKESMTNREWANIEATGTTDENGDLLVLIRFIARWEHPRDFFIDAIELDYVDEEQPIHKLGDARIPYKRTYVRVNSNCTVAQYLATVAWAYDNKYTIGFSADDAGIGVGLGDKHIIEVGNQYNRQEIEQWYFDNYGILADNIEHIDYPSGGV